MGCEAENFPRSPRRIRQLCHSCGSQPERTVSRGGRVPDLVASRLPRPTISGRGFNLFNPLRRHFRATPFCRLGNEFVERLGTDSEARKKANAPQPLIRLLATGRCARRGPGSTAGAGGLLDGGTLTAWPWVIDSESGDENVSTIYVYQKWKSIFSLQGNPRPFGGGLLPPPQGSPQGGRGSAASYRMADAQR